MQIKASSFFLISGTIFVVIFLQSGLQLHGLAEHEDLLVDPGMFEHARNMNIGDFDQLQTHLPLYMNRLNTINIRNISEDFDSIFYKVDLKAEIETSLFGSPLDPLENFRNPCWVSKLPSRDPYSNNSKIHDLRIRKQWNVQQMTGVFRNRASHGGTPWRMRCVPYAMLIGVSKSGTTDLFSKLMAHPDIAAPFIKEMTFWNRQRIGKLFRADEPERYISFSDYVDCFDQAAENILQSPSDSQPTPQGPLYHHKITMDGTPSYLWDYTGWEKIPGNRGLREPRYTMAHTLYSLTPRLRLLVLLRHPTDRLYSHFGKMSKNTSVEAFHALVTEALQLWLDCTAVNTVRACAYNQSLVPFEYTDGITLRASVYSVFIKDWMKVFPADQFHFMRAEEYYANMTELLQDVFTFLGARQLTNTEMLQVVNRKMKNKNKRKPDEMMEETRRLLNTFFQPFILELNSILKRPMFAID